jgi:hypothetical protein
MSLYDTYICHEDDGTGRSTSSNGDAATLIEPADTSALPYAFHNLTKSTLDTGHLFLGLHMALDHIEREEGEIISHATKSTSGHEFLRS